MEFARPFSVLDGGLSTALEERGHELGSSLWTARLLTDAPAELVEAHLASLRAGAEVIISSSYQASVDGFVAAGLGRTDAVALLGLTTELAREAVYRYGRERPDEPRPLVAASVGPYGATLADGSEYVGNYDLDGPGLVEFHAARLEVLIASGPDLLACETIPSAAEASAILAALARFPNVPTWISFSCLDGAHTSAGEPIEDAVRIATATRQVVAVGVNCTSPRHVAELLERAAAVTDLPLVAYANNGRRWDADHRCWSGDPDPTADPEVLARWIDAGARLIGGCCGVGPTAIAELRAHRDAYVFPFDAA